MAAESVKAKEAGVFAGLHVVLGVTGGIAAYKAVEIVSRLRKCGAEVHVIMTEAATQFVTELTFREISGQPVSVDMWAKVPHFHVEHIALAQLADVVLVAPATANILAKAANGIADDMLSTTLLATKAPVFFAPAMNTAMYEHPATQHNMDVLRARGAHILEPASGPLACGTSGKGRLPEPVEIVAALEEYLQKKQSLAGKKILVTAGGTEEPLDPVRYLGNHSTGRMGYAIAREAARRGADVVLLSGPAMLPVPEGVRLISVQTARQMYDAAMQESMGADVVIMAAAVADYRPAVTYPHKIKKGEGSLTLTLERNPDILLELGRRKRTGQILVGFAAETQNLHAYAKAKLEKKNLDLIVANDVSREDAGFAAETNEAILFARDGQEREIPLMQKTALAAILLDSVEKRLP